MEIIPLIKSGWFLSSNSFLVKNKSGKGIVIDTSLNKKRYKILETLKENISLDEVSLIILTHSHYDHTGSLSFLKKYLKNAKVIIHKSESHLLEKGECIIPKGNTISSSLVSFFGSYLNYYTSFGKYEPVIPDIKVDKEYKINEFGYILHTPGHSQGSVSIILDNKTAFVGDMMNYNWNNVYNPLSDDESLNISQWKKLLDLGIKIFYPGHGTKISSEIVKKMYYKLKKV